MMISLLFTNVVKIPPRKAMTLVLQKTAHTLLQRGTSQPEPSAFWELWCTQLSCGLPATINHLWKQLPASSHLKCCQRIYQNSSGPTWKKILNCLEEILERDWMRLSWSYTLFFSIFLPQTHLLVCFLLLYECACIDVKMWSLKIRWGSTDDGLSWSQGESKGVGETI